MVVAANAPCIALDKARATISLRITILPSPSKTPSVKKTRRTTRRAIHNKEEYIGMKGTYVSL
jgi:hypothetical protein